MKTILVDAYLTLILPDTGVDKDLRQLLDTYPNSKIVLTNATADQMIQMGIDKSPYEVFTCSHEPDKIDPDFYKKFLSKYNLSADDVVYFEHAPEAVTSAQSIGITTYHFNSDVRDLAALKKFLDENA